MKIFFFYLKKSYLKSKSEIQIVTIVNMGPGSIWDKYSLDLHRLTLRAMHCNAVQCNAIQCNTIQYIIVTVACIPKKYRLNAKRQESFCNGVSSIMQGWKILEILVQATEKVTKVAQNQCHCWVTTLPNMTSMVSKIVFP